MFMLFLGTLLLALATAFPNPSPCSGDCWAHDPSLVQRQSDGKHFLFSTGPGIQISTASNIGGPWTRVGEVLPNGSSVHVPGADSKTPWAPDVHFLDGTYYLYYTVSALGKKDSSIGVASSPTLDPGSWEDHGAIGISTDNSSPYNAIDANWIVIGKTYYLNFGSFWNGIQQVVMKDSLTKEQSAKPYQIAYNASGEHATEASTVYKRGDFYYLLFSSGIADDYAANRPEPGAEARIVVCRSTTGTGGFVDRNNASCTKTGGTTVLNSHGFVYGPGGQGILDDKELGDVLYYHYANTDIGFKIDQYQLGYNKINWTDGWPVLLGPPE